MPDKASEPPELRRKKILEKIQTDDHDVLTTSEVAEDITEVGQKTVGRNLEWMMEYDVLDGRQAGDSKTWLWWVSAEGLSASTSVATARQIEALLEELYHKRWEFRLMAFGLVALVWFSSLSFWAAVLNALGIKIVSMTTILITLVVGFVLASSVIFIGLFLFPIETYGSWPDAVNLGESDEQ